VNGPDPKLVEVLRAALTRGPALQLAVLFGSRARGDAREDSDFDLGIVPVDPALSLHDELALAAVLSEAVRGEVDVVRLDADNPLLGREVAHTGVCVFEPRPGAFSAYRAEAVSRWLDFDAAIAPYRARFLSRLRGTA
jgi:hypothetical protein